MERELQQYYENQFELFSLPGWKDFVGQVQDMYDTYNEVTTIGSAEQLFFIKGQLDILQWLLKWEQSVLETYKTIQESTNDDSSDF